MATIPNKPKKKLSEKQQEVLKKNQYKKGQVSSEEAAKNGSKGGKQQYLNKLNREALQELYRKSLKDGDLENLIEKHKKRAGNTEKELLSFYKCLGIDVSDDTNITIEANDFAFKFKYNK